MKLLSMRRVLPVILAMCLVCAFTPLMANADSEEGSAEALAKLINEFEPNSQELDAPLVAVAEGNVVTVRTERGQPVEGVDTKLALVINSGVTVAWKADYSDYGREPGGDAGSGSGVDGGSEPGDQPIGESKEPMDALISLVGDGGFELQTGGALTTYSDGVVSILSYGSMVLVSGGTIENANSAPIISYGGDIEISGGIVTAQGIGGRGVVVYNGDVTVSDGSVTASGESGTAVLAMGGDVIITGGSVIASGSGGHAIELLPGTNLSVAAYLSGTIIGEVSAETEQEVDGIKGGVERVTNGIIVEADSLLVHKERDGGADGLTVKDGKISAAWDMSGAQPAINFTLNDNTTRSLQWGEKGYKLTVIKGTSSAPLYEVGANAQIVANPVPSGQIFDKWVVSEGGGTLANENSEATTFTMPANDATVTATYKPEEKDTAPAPISISGGNAKKISNKAYTGKHITPRPSIKVNGKTLKAGTDYIVSYKNNVKIGKAKITLKGKGKYTGTKTVSFKIVPKKTSVTKAAVGKKQIKITWKKVSAKQKITKYQVRYKVKGTKKWEVKTVPAKKNSLTIKNLKSGKQCRIQVRSYKTVSKVKYHSAWSAVSTTKKIK